MDDGGERRHLWDPSILPSIHLSAILNGPEEGIPAESPTFGDVLPSSRVFAGIPP